MLTHEGFDALPEDKMHVTGCDMAWGMVRR